MQFWGEEYEEKWHFTQKSFEFHKIFFLLHSNEKTFSQLHLTIDRKTAGVIYNSANFIY